MNVPVEISAALKRAKLASIVCLYLCSCYYFQVVNSSGASTSAAHTFTLPVSIVIYY